MAGKFQQALKAYLESLPAQPAWDRHVPDSLYGAIEDHQDFVDFLKFVSENGRTELLEYGGSESIEFVQRLHARLVDPVVTEFARSKGIHSDLGILAYSFVLALGEP
jgi:hypothetical protein